MSSFGLGFDFLVFFLPLLAAQFATLETKGELGRVYFRKAFWDCYKRQGKQLTFASLVTIAETTYLSNTPTDLCMALLNFSLFCFVLYSYAFVQYCNVKTIQYNAMHKFVGVLDNPQKQLRDTFRLYSLSLF